ncbi:MAG: hypothetical protein IJ297_07360 [Clostridia bacterium]|nr:hypothetical protein [Clostridia bacterium]
MVHRIFPQYPDYMQDFEELTALCNAQKSVFKLLWANFDELVTAALANYSSTEWRAMITAPKDGTLNDRLKKTFCGEHLATIDTLRKYVSCLVEEDYFTLDYDKDTMKFFMKISKNCVGWEKIKKDIREILPCNTLLEIEEVDSVA